MKWIAALLLLLLLSASVSLAQQNQPRTIFQPDGPQSLRFEPNRGQVASRYRYLARGRGYGIYLSDTELLLRVHRNRQVGVLRMQMEDAHPVSITGEAPLGEMVNYVMRKDVIGNVPRFQRVRYADVYPGIDLIYYENKGQLEYDFVLRPGSDPRAIAITLKGAGIKVNRSGDLLVRSGVAWTLWKRPNAYQVAGGKRKTVAASYVIDHESIGFHVGRYDHSRELVIDPVLVFSTYLGGSKGVDDPAQTNGGNDEVQVIASDSAGNVYVAGQTNSVDFPTTPGTLEPASPLPATCSPGVTCDLAAFITKLSPKGTRIYSTYLTHANAIEGISAIAIDSGGRAVLGVVSANPSASDFGNASVKILNATGSALDFDAVVDDSPTSSTGIRGIAVDPQGKIYIGGFSTDSSLPVTANAFQSQRASGTDAYVAKIDPTKTGTAMFEYLSYFGGTNLDSLGGIAVRSGNIYFTGVTLSKDLPVTPGVFGPVRQDGEDSYIAKVNPNLSGSASLIYSTHLRGTFLHSIAVDTSGNAYVAGATPEVFPNTFEATPGAFQTTRGLDPCGSGGRPSCGDATVSKINAGATAVLFSTFLGGAGEENDVSMALNSANDVFVTGTTTSTNFPVTADALRRTRNASGCSNPACARDVFLAVLNSAGSSLRYGSYIGGTQSDVAGGIAVASNGTAWVGGSTQSRDFPTNSTSFQHKLRGPGDGFVAKFSNTKLCGLSASIPSVTICTPSGGAAVSSPVELVTGATDSRNVVLIQVYVDAQKQYEVKNARSFETSLPLAPGVHRLTVQATNSAAVIYKRTISITVH